MRLKTNQLIDAINASAVGEVKSLVASGLDLDAAGDDGTTPLIEAALLSNGDTSIASVLLLAGANPNTSDSGEGWTPLHVAARDHNIAVIQLLLAHGASVDTVDQFGNTPLHRRVCSSKGRTEAIEVLFSHGASATATNKYGVSPLSLAEQLDEQEIIRVFHSSC